MPLFVGMPVAYHFKPGGIAGSMSPELNATDEKMSVLLFRVGKALCALPNLERHRGYARARCSGSLRHGAVRDGSQCNPWEKVPVVDLGDLFGLGSDRSGRTRFVNCTRRISFP